MLECKLGKEHQLHSFCESSSGDMLAREPAMLLYVARIGSVRKTWGDLFLSSVVSALSKKNTHLLMLRKSMQYTIYQYIYIS